MVREELKPHFVLLFFEPLHPYLTSYLIFVVLASENFHMIPLSVKGIEVARSNYIDITQPLFHIEIHLLDSKRK